MDIGVIDTGLDYTHADFGGAGTPAAYDDALAASTSGDWITNLTALGRAKIKGGWDFVGNDYNADPTDLAYNPVPDPDPNPLDCAEHGTHVAGTATGYGVDGDGGTFTGDYAALTAADLRGMAVGPGMAPAADLYPLKVFGCEGSTEVVIEALDWSLDPNGDGDFSDHLDVVNLSLGSDYGLVDDPEAEVVAELFDHGVLSVISIGNNGDLTDTGGAPGNAVSSLAVASSVDSYQLRDGLVVDAPAEVAGVVPGQMSVDYDWAGNGPSGLPVTGGVVPLSQPPTLTAAHGARARADAGRGARARSPGWSGTTTTATPGRCGSVDRSANVKAAGAIGAVLTSDLNVFDAGITGDADIPVIQLPRDVVTQLQPAVEAGTLDVTFDGAQQAQIKDFTPSLTDTLSSFTSRGPHGSIGVVKPDVAAPGDTVASAGMGSGDGPLVMSGTSMAAPLTAGVAALVKSRHPAWTPLMVKAAVMNTAGHDLWTRSDRTGRRYAPARVGAGRVDAARATRTKVLAYVTRPAAAVSASFGVVPAKVTRSKVTRTRTLVVRNTGSKAVKVRLSYDAVNPAAGVGYSVSPASLTVRPRSTGRAVVRMTVAPKKLRHTIDKTMAKHQMALPRQFVSDASGRVLVKPGSQQALRVPVYGAAKPVSTTTASVYRRKILLQGAGVDQGTGATAYTSVASVMQLGATSGVLPTCAAGAEPIGCTSLRSEKAGDIRAIGAGTGDGLLWFGVASQGDWANIGNVFQPYVDYDIDGDDLPDVETYATNYPGTDVLLAVTYDLHTGDHPGHAAGERRLRRSGHQRLRHECAPAAGRGGLPPARHGQRADRLHGRGVEQLHRSSDRGGRRHDPLRPDESPGDHGPCAVAGRGKRADPVHGARPDEGPGLPPARCHGSQVPGAHPAGPPLTPVDPSLVHRFSTGVAVNKRRVSGPARCTGRPCSRPGRPAPRRPERRPH